MPTDDLRGDPKEFVAECAAWSSDIRRGFDEDWIRFDASVRLGDVYGSGADHTYPHLQSGDHRPPIIIDTETYSNVTTMATNIYAQTVGDDEFFRVEAFPDARGQGDDEAAATTVERLGRRFWKRPGHQTVWWKACYDVATYGLAWLDDPVVPEVEMGFGPFREQLASGLVLPDIRPVAKVRNEMHLRNIHVLDFLADWTKPPGAAMRWGIKIGRMTAGEFKDFVIANQGDVEAADRAIKNNTKAFWTHPQGQKWRNFAYNQLTEEDLKGPEAYQGIQFYEFRGEVPWFQATDPRKYRCIIIANDEVAINVPQPYYRHPWRALNMLPFNGRPYGMGTAEVSQSDMDELSTYRTLRAKAAVKTVNAPLLADPNRFENSEQLEEPASDQVIFTRGDPTGATALVAKDYNALFSASTLINEGRQWTREANGIMDITRGIAAGARTSAFEARELAAGGSLGLNVRIDLIEQENMMEIARDIPQRYLFALRDSSRQLGIAPDDLLRQYTHSPVAQLAHLYTDLDMIFQGSRRFRASGAMAGVVAQVASLVAAFPIAGPLINVPQLITDALKGISPDAIERYLNSPEVAAGQALAQEALTGPTQGSPSAPRPPSNVG